MLSQEEENRLNVLATNFAATLAQPGGPVSDAQLAFDVHIVLQLTLTSAGIPASRLTPAWSPEDDFDSGGWRLQVFRFQDAIRVRNPAYRNYSATTRHATDTFKSKRPEVEKYLADRIRATL